MADFLTASLVLALLVFSFSVSADQRIITAEPGENVILPCRADENKDVIFVEWSRTDLEADEYVLLYIFNRFDSEGQSPSFSNRVSLLDVKNGDVSLVLKNVTTHNTGRYECRVRQRGNNRRKRALVDPNSIINLIVGPDRINITAEPGDNVILLYRADKMEDVRILVWNRTGLESGQPVLLYRDWWFPPEFQLWSSPSFRNWGDLLDVKNGDVSLVLKDVTTEDTGIYVCQVFENGAYHRLIQKSISIINLRVKPGQRIRAEPGDNVILTCRAAENKEVIVVQWNRNDLESDQYVLRYRDKRFDPEIQSPSFRNRVDLLDVKNGDVSLVLKDVTADDTGIYECRVVQRGNNRRNRSILKTEPISTIPLRVEPGNKEDGGRGLDA